MTRQMRRQLERQQAKKRGYRHISAVIGTNPPRLVQVLEKGSDQDSAKYLAVTDGHEFNICVDQEDFKRGEITIMFSKEQQNDIQKYVPYIDSIITVMKKANFTGIGITTQQLKKEMKDPNKEFLYHQLVD